MTVFKLQSEYFSTNPLIKEEYCKENRCSFLLSVFVKLASSNEEPVVIHYIMNIFGILTGAIFQESRIILKIFTHTCNGAVQCLEYVSALNLYFIERWCFSSFVSSPVIILVTPTFISSTIPVNLNHKLHQLVF